MEIKGGSGYCNPLYPTEKIRTKNINIKYINLQVNIFQTNKKLTKYLFFTTICILMHNYAIQYRHQLHYHNLF